MRVRERRHLYYKTEPQILPLATFFSRPVLDSIDHKLAGSRDRTILKISGRWPQSARPEQPMISLFLLARLPAYRLPLQHPYLGSERCSRLRFNVYGKLHEMVMVNANGKKSDLKIIFILNFHYNKQSIDCRIDRCFY